MCKSSASQETTENIKPRWDATLIGSICKNRVDFKKNSRAFLGGALGLTVEMGPDLTQPELTFDPQRLTLL